LETIPSALYILTRHAKNPKKAIIRAVNDTHDNDTIGVFELLEAARAKWN